MYYIFNTSKYLSSVFTIFRGVAWVNGKYFFGSNRSKNLDEDFDVSWYRNRSLPNDYRACPPSYLQKLELKKYANNTVKTRSEEHTSELQSRPHLVCRLLLEKKKKKK